MTSEDTYIAEAIKNNDNDALERVMDAYSNLLLRTAYLMLKDLKLAEDVTQEAFIKFYYSMGSFRGEASIKTYLSRILVNECRQRMRKNWFRRVFVTDRLEEVQGDAPDFVEDSAVRMDLSSSLMGLDMKYREVLLLHYYNDLSVKEIAYALGQPEGTIKSRLKRGRDMLRDITREVEFRDE